MLSFADFEVLTFDCYGTLIDGELEFGRRWINDAITKKGSERRRWHLLTQIYKFQTSKRWQTEWV